MLPPEQHEASPGPVPLLGFVIAGFCSLQDYLSWFL